MKGRTVGVDATTLEANAAMKTIVRRDNGQSYDQFLTALAKASGIETPTREDLQRIDKKRKKKTSNKEWVNPHDPDARVTKMKDGSTHLAHKAEHAVDMETGAVLAVTVQGADQGDTSTVRETLAEAGQTVAALVEQESQRGAETNVNVQGIEEVVTDKGYHSNAVLTGLKQSGTRSYIPEPQRGKRKWEGKAEEKQAVYANRKRIKGRYGKRLLKKRGELIERSFEHNYGHGGMRRIHLRGHENILKRILIHVSAYNLSLILRETIGAGTPKELRSVQTELIVAILWLHSEVGRSYEAETGGSHRFTRPPVKKRTAPTIEDYSLQTRSGS
ncbi:MAG: transposase [Bryobacterales bacterium]|nr:transposase [Bryobacterales bacterium]